MSCISFCNRYRRNLPCIPKTSKGNVRCLEGVYDCIAWSIKVLASAILISTILCFFIRLPEPCVYLTGMRIEAIDANLNKPDSTLLHYNLTLRNGDLYKHLHYDVLVLRITHSAYASNKGKFVIDFKNNGTAVQQSPGETTLLPYHTLNYSYYWKNDSMMALKNQTATINLMFVMEVRFGIFNRSVRRQATRFAQVYFNVQGEAFINRRRGLKLK